MQDKHKKAIRIAAGLALIAYASKAYWLKQPDTDKKPAPVAAAVKVDTSRSLGSLKFKPCSLASPLPNGEPLEAQCTTLSVPEDHATRRPHDPMALAWLPASKRPSPTRCSCSPAAPARRRSSPSPHRARLRRSAQEARRDPGRPARHRRVQPADLQGRRGQERGRRRPTTTRSARADRLRRAVRRQPLAEKADLRFYTTTDAIQDLDAVRARIGAATDQPDGRVLRHPRRAAVRHALPAAHAHDHLDGIVPNTLVARQRIRAQPRERARRAVRRVPETAGLHADTRQTRASSSTR